MNEKILAITPNSDLTTTRAKLLDKELEVIQLNVELDSQYKTIHVLKEKIQFLDTKIEDLKKNEKKREITEGEESMLNDSQEERFMTALPNRKNEKIQSLIEENKILISKINDLNLILKKSENQNELLVISIEKMNDEFKKLQKIMYEKMIEMQKMEGEKNIQLICNAKVTKDLESLKQQKIVMQEDNARLCDELNKITNEMLSQTTKYSQIKNDNSTVIATLTESNENFKRQIDQNKIILTEKELKIAGLISTNQDLLDKINKLNIIVDEVENLKIKNDILSIENDNMNASSKILNVKLKDLEEESKYWKKNSDLSKKIENEFEMMKKLLEKYQGEIGDLQKQISLHNNEKLTIHSSLKEEQNKLKLEYDKKIDDLNQKIEILSKNNNNMITLEKAYENKNMEHEKIILENREMKFILSTKEEQIKFLDDKVKFLELNNENLQKKADLFFDFKLEDTKSIDLDQKIPLGTLDLNMKEDFFTIRKKNELKGREIETLLNDINMRKEHYRENLKKMIAEKKTPLKKLI